MRSGAAGLLSCLVGGTGSILGMALSTLMVNTLVTYLEIKRDEEKSGEMGDSI